MTKEILIEFYEDELREINDNMKKEDAIIDSYDFDEVNENRHVFERYTKSINQLNVLRIDRLRIEQFINNLKKLK